MRQNPLSVPKNEALRIEEEDLLLVRKTRSAFAEDADRTAAAFYGTLFRQAPGLRSMFPHDLDDQGRKLCAMVSAAIGAAGEMETLTPVLAELARRHVAYGVTAGHYALVGRALLATLADLGVTPAHVAAWERTYAVLSGVMIAAAYPAPARAAEGTGQSAAKL